MTDVAPSKNAVYDEMELRAPKASPTISGLLTHNGGQIKFPATQSASSDVNTLDDYEEGSWDPVLYFGETSAPTQTMLGRYTKIGRLVLLSCQLSSFTKTGTESGNAIIGGVPITSNVFSAGTIYPYKITYTGTLVPFIDSTGYINLRTCQEDGNNVFLTHANFSSGATFYMQFAYYYQP